MNSVGVLLKKEREKKKISWDEISEDTKIGVKYLKALETDNYTIFPGETYIIGFMRNYARALGLDPAEIINQYKSMKISTSIEAKLETGIKDKVQESSKLELMEKKEKIKKPEKTKSQNLKKTIDKDLEGMEVIELPEEETTEKKKKEKEHAFKKKEKGLNIFKMPLKEKKLINIAHIVIGGGAVVVFILLFLIVKFIFTSLIRDDSNKIYTDLNEIKYLEFTGNVLQADFVSNEYYKIKLGEKTYNVLFEVLTELSDVNDKKSDKEKFKEFIFRINDITIPVRLKEEKSFDFDYDTKNDLKVKVISYNNDLINARINKLHSFIVLSSNELNVTGSSNTNKKAKANQQSKKSKGNMTKEKIVLEAVVREKTYIKAFIDGREQEGIIYYPKDKILLEAEDVMQLKIGNAGGIIAKINGKLTKLGKRGEIANKVIKWQRDPYDDSVYNLVIKDWQ